MNDGIKKLKAFQLMKPLYVHCVFICYMWLAVLSKRQKRLKLLIFGATR